MKRIFRILFILFIVGISLNLKPKVVQGFPPLPSSFYGTVKINSKNVANGTLIEALVNGKVYAQSYTQMYEGDSVYTVSIPGDDPGTATVDGAREGDVISFKVGGIAAQQTGTWHSGTNEQLDLSAVTSNTPNTPAPTPTSYPTQTAIPTVNTPVPTTAAATPTRGNVTQSAATATLVTVGGTSIGGTPSAADTPVSPGSISPEELTLTSQAGEGTGADADEPGRQKNAGRIFWFIAIPVVITLGIIAGLWLMVKKLRDH